MVRLQALSLGHALDLDWAGTGAVHSVFPRAVNLEIEGDLWTLLSAERADLPFGARIATEDFTPLGLRRGDRVSVRSGLVGVGSENTALVVDCRAAPRWLPVHPDRRAPGLVERLRVVAAAANPRAWPGSAPMAHAILSALNHSDSLCGVLADVVGCGPGSTPAGDDVLVGILAILTSPHAGAAGAAAAQSLCRSLYPLLPTTTDISGHLLRQAASGLFGRPVHELVCALIGDPAPEHSKDAVRHVLDMGATSGADLCLGLLAAAPAFFLTHDERAAA